MMENLKTIEQLIEGECVVVASNGHTTKNFKGSYSEKLEVVFFTISSDYEVLGYIQ